MKEGGKREHVQHGRTSKFDELSQLWDGHSESSGCIGRAVNATFTHCVQWLHSRKSNAGVFLVFIPSRRGLLHAPSTLQLLLAPVQPATIARSADRTHRAVRSHHMTSRSALIISYDSWDHARSIWPRASAWSQRLIPLQRLSRGPVLVHRLRESFGQPLMQRGIEWRQTEGVGIRTKF